MKKILFLFFVGALLLSFSCKKKCTCVTYNEHGGKTTKEETVKNNESCSKLDSESYYSYTECK